MAGPDETTRTMPLPTPPPAPAARGPREPSVGLYGLAAVIGGSMIALVLAALGAFDASATGVAVGLGIGALAMTVAAIALARRRGAFVLIALAGLLAIGAGGTAAVGDQARDGVGERTQSVMTPSDLAREHRLGIGSLTVEVSPGALTRGVSSLRARVGIGELVVRVPTGVAVAIPEGFAGFVQPRSGRALRDGLSFANSPGLIDAHYRGEIKVIAVNLDTETPIQIARGDKIAQLVIERVERVALAEVDDLGDTARGEGGFGSTGHR